MAMSKAKGKYIVDSDMLCPGCKIRCLTIDVSIKEIESADDGWKLSGTGDLQFSRYCSCPICGMMCTGLLQTIPIECSTFKCPNCGQDDSLRYAVLRITANGTAFTFEAEIACSKCQKRAWFKTIIKKLLSLVKIKVGPTGISVEQK
jgi:hypothetical protein